MWWQLIQELLDSKLLPWTVHVGDLILRQTREIQLDLGENLAQNKAKLESINTKN